MFAIATEFVQIGGVLSRDHGREWWNGRAWSPAKNEAKLFDSSADAESHAADESLSGYLVLDVSENDSGHKSVGNPA